MRFRAAGAPSAGFRLIAVVAAPCALLAACSSGEQQDAVSPEPTLTGNPVMTTAPDGGPMAPGQWFIEEDAGGASARFGPPVSEAVLALGCDAATQTLTFTRAGTHADEAGAPQTHIVEAGDQAASLDMTPTGGELPMLQVEIDRDQPILPALARAGDVITMTAPDGEVLRVPAAPGIERVIEACSSN